MNETGPSVDDGAGVVPQEGRLLLGRHCGLHFLARRQFLFGRQRRLVRVLARCRVLGRRGPQPVPHVVTQRLLEVVIDTARDADFLLGSRGGAVVTAAAAL